MKNNLSNANTDAMTETEPGMRACGSEQDSIILAEIRKLRQEHTEAAKDNKTRLARLESNMKELVERKALLEQQTVEMEERLGDNEDRMVWRGRWPFSSKRKQDY